ncbi:MAG: BatA domain-containing protein [Planctomycetota bacterium]
MSFIQPWMLWAMPLIALPVIIHLINQRRFQTQRWAAMTFLLAANKMSSGYAKIRRYLILAARTLAIAGLLFAVARPLSSGWFGAHVGSRVDTTIILVDRSPSMEASSGNGGTKLQSLISQLTDSLNVVQSNRYVWIDDDSGDPVELESIEQLSSLSVDKSSAATADIAGMLETATSYIRDNQPSSVEVWIVSDLRRSDWSVASGRWNAINQSLLALPQSVRLHLLTAEDPTDINRSIRVSSAQRIDPSSQTGGISNSLDGSSGPAARSEVQQDDVHLRLSLMIQQVGEENDDDVDGSIPVELDLEGARSELQINVTGGITEVANLTIPLDAGKMSGWGRVSLPADSNLADNDFYFVYGEPTVRRTLVITEDATDGETETAKPLMLAAGIAPDAETRCEAIAATSDDLASVDLNEVAMVLWTEDLPDASNAALLKPFLDRGGRLLFFAPQGEVDESAAFAGIKWSSVQSPSDPNLVSTWIGGHDLLSSVRSGAALPVGDLRIKRYRKLEGSRFPLAMLPDETPLLARAIEDQRGIYFITTNVLPEWSTLARDGVVLYAMLQRAVSDGAGTLGSTRQLLAGETTLRSDDWSRSAGPNVGTSTHFSRYQGIFTQGGDSESGSERRLIAVNRGDGEDAIATVTSDQLSGLFANLDFDLITQQAGATRSLVQEIWRLFLGIMMLALVCEALLCLPRRRGTASSPAAPTPAGLGPGATKKFGMSGSANA